LLSSPVLSAKLSPGERDILDTPVSELSAQVRSGKLDRGDVLKAYAKAAKRAHERTNCLTEILFKVNSGSGEITLAGSDGEEGEKVRGGSLAGVPVSLKDTIMVKGFDTSVGYSRWTGMEEVEDGGIVKLLREAGAMPFVKTNLPITLLSFESTNDVSPPPTAP
jgi:Asp-tRNA(Asn)/Glu-tRNA(Gln) amidotransferase A subunit family amidase